VDPEYGDRYGRVFRKSVLDGSELPNARLISNMMMAETESRQSKIASQMLMNWGQVLGNEITYPAAQAGDAKSQCCSPNVSEENRNEECVPLKISPDDEFYGPTNMTCFPFMRTPACIKCRAQPRRALNLHTAAIDGSTIYGNCIKDSVDLREFQGGLLKDSRTNFLPNLGQEEPYECGQINRRVFPERHGVCFKTGDSYVNNNPFKAALVTILMREHNRIARGLQEITDWDDETLFQEARKIVGAIMEVITYQEWLPVILGEEVMNHFGLSVLPPSEFTEYNPDLDFSTSAEFTTAAMRAVGHSLISDKTVLSYFNGTIEPYPLKDTYFWNQAVIDGRMDAIIRGTVTQPCSAPDIYMDDVIRNYFGRFTEPVGLDLPAVDIMRGRDHGVASYVSFRKWCGDSLGAEEQEGISFDSLTSLGIMTAYNANKLSQVYSTPEDIDLYTGMLMETPLPGAMIGATGACIWGREFHRKKYGDRYYFEHEGQSGSFSSEQLSSLKQMTLARVLCVNGDEYPRQRIQKRVMLLPSESNPEVDCTSFPDLDLTLWID
jgi:peroxidase